MRFCKTIFYCVIVLGVWAGTVSADLSFTAYSFSSLFKSADCVVYGEVTEVSADETGLHMTFAIKETLMGSLAGTVTVTSPLYNGAFMEDQAYLGQERLYVLFLTQKDTLWIVVNGAAGALNGEFLLDVRIIAGEYANNTDLFSKTCIATQESIFDLLAMNDSKKRLLEGMKGQFSDSDATFLSKLLFSGEPYL